MIGSMFNHERRQTEHTVWQKAKKQAQNNNQHPTAEDFVETVLSGLEESRIDIHEDTVPVDGGTDDETYYTHDTHQLMGHTNEKIWFKTNTTQTVVETEISEILGKRNLNLSIMDSRSFSDDMVKYTLTVPFITDDERQQKVRQETIEIARELREYNPVHEDDIVGDCSRDDCDGKSYQDGMGEYGPVYRCTRIGCDRKFEKYL